MDRNQATGLVLIFAILFAYFTFFAPSTPEQRKPQKQEKGTPAATANAELPQPKADASFAKTSADSTAPAFSAKDYTLANDDLELTVSTAGGQIKSARLLKYKTYFSQPLYILTSQDAHLDLKLQDAQGRSVDVGGLPFTATQQGRTLHLEARRPDGSGLRLSYALAESGYQVSVSAQNLQGGGFKAGQISFHQDLKLTEKDFAQSRAAATTTFLTTEEDFDNLNEASTDPVDMSPAQPLRWITHKQKFFLAALINRGAGFEKATVKAAPNLADSTVVKTLDTKATFAPADLAKGAAFDLYLGPNQYKLLKTVAPEFERNVYLGWPVIRWVNKYVVVNVFDFLQKFIGSYGLIILLLVIFIRALLLPLGYRSYLSMAKMRVLKPEIDEIKARVGEDNMTAIQQEQMKLYQQVGINPLSGCIPLLLQMPILLAMFNFFPNAIELRQEHLWWAEDLSTWDSVATLPFSLPGYGSHVSLFTILMTISTLAVTYVNASSSAVTGPMASMQYVMPVIFMFILNSLPAGLSFYYLVSNLVSMGQQFLIKRSVKDTDIRARLEENKIKNVTKKPGKFAARLQDALKQAQEAQKAQEATKHKK